MSDSTGTSGAPSAVAPIAPTPTPTPPPHTSPSHRLLPLTLTALGVVYGDIGTSPLYAMRECFFGSHAVPPTPANVLGVLSLIIYALLLVVSVKYVLIVLRADNRGEGGILALTALVPGRAATPASGGRLAVGRPVLIALGIFGTSAKAAAVVPNKLVQCAAMGKAIVTRRSAAVERWFTDDVDLAMVEAADAEALARRLIELRDDPAARARLGAGARAVFERRYAASRQRETLAAILARVGVTPSLTRTPARAAAHPR